MARIKYGSLVTDISGSIGGITFQRSNYGTTLRIKPIPKKSDSPPQQNVKRIMMQLHAAWSALSPASRVQWDQYIAFCNAKIKRDSNVLMSGHDLFLKYNMNRVLAGFGILTTLSYISTVQPAKISQLSVYGTNIYVMFLNVINPNTLWFNLKLSAPRFPALAFSSLGLRYMKVSPSLSNAFLLNNQYTAVFGAHFLVGQTIHYSIQSFSTLAPLFTTTINSKIIIT